MAGGRMSRTSLVAVVVVAAVGLLVAGVAVYGGQHGWDTRFTWGAVFACVYAAVFTWLVAVTGVMEVIIRPRQCSCERRYSTTAAYVGGHACGCALAEKELPAQPSVGPVLRYAPIHQN